MAPGDPPINANRELLATGAANIGGALFGAMPAGGGSGGSVILQSATSVSAQGQIDIRGGDGVVIQPGATQLLNFRTTGGNGSPGFVVSKGRESGPSLFVFDSEAGVISGWSPTTDARSSRARNRSDSH